MTESHRTMPHDFTPPPTRRAGTVDTLHGVGVSDPYRWLEDGQDPEVIAWTRAQDAASTRFLGALPGRALVEDRLTDLHQVEEVMNAQLAGGRIFTLIRKRGNQQPTLFVRSGEDGEDRPVLDIEHEDPGCLRGLDWWYPSQDGRMLAYGVSHGGDEWSLLRVRDVDSGRDLDDAIPRVRSASIAWLPDSTGFLYTRYPQPGEVPGGEDLYFRRIYRHVLGTLWEDDPLVLGEGRPATDRPGVLLDDAGRWLVVYVDHGWAKTEIFVMDLLRPQEGFRDITPPDESAHELIGIHDGVLYSQTHAGAPNGQVLAYHLAETADGWDAVIPERDDRIIEQVASTAFGFVTVELQDASPVVRRYARDGSALGDVQLSEIGRIDFVRGAPDAGFAILAFSSFVRPATLLAVDDAGPVRELVPSDIPPGFDPDSYEIVQEWFTLRDGTRAPMFLVHRRDIQRDGSAPTVLHGYGGFRVVMGSRYWPDVPVWLEHGGVFVTACLRGGGEFGMEWHRAGMLERKQNVFDDVIAAAEHLVEIGVTSPEHLGVRGASNGGLLAGAAITQRPDLFRAARSSMPLLDMLRYHRFQIARTWIPEYGSADDPEQFRYLYDYSPYHHVEEGIAYPALLLTCALNDSRVDPMHARKMTARLQAATSGGPDRPILLRAEEDAGHGAGQPLDALVREDTDAWTFFGWALGMNWEPRGQGMPSPR
jgi:prolyl oligopeptidase